MLPTLWASADVVAVDKPSGLLVHNSSFTRTRERSAVTIVREALGPDWSPVHRLDRGTSGVLLFARGAEALRAWQAALDGSRRYYLALVRGQVKAGFDVDHALDDERGVRRDAQSHVEPVWSRAEPRCSLVRVEPVQGRTHQVRRHCAFASHHVLGDANYGKGPLNREYRARFGLARLALHAERLAVTDPSSGAALEVASPLPDDLAEPIARILRGEEIAPPDR
ncbi:MAG: pseudouridine synthase [Polyangiales bacterium]